MRADDCDALAGKLNVKQIWDGLYANAVNSKVIISIKTLFLHCNLSMGGSEGMGGGSVMRNVSNFSVELVRVLHIPFENNPEQSAENIIFP